MNFFVYLLCVLLSPSQALTQEEYAKILASLGANWGGSGGLHHFRPSRTRRAAPPTPATIPATEESCEVMCRLYGGDMPTLRLCLEENCGITGWATI